LFKIFIDNVINYTNENNPHASVIGMKIPGLPFEDDDAFCSLTIKGFQKAIDQVTK
jgi:hypothetical protein